MRAMSVAGLPAVSDLDGVDHVEPQLGEVGEVFEGETAVVQARMDEPQALEPPGVGALSFQLGDGYASCCSRNHILHRALPAEKKAYLDADFPGKP